MIFDRQDVNSFDNSVVVHELESKKTSNDQESTQSDPTSCPQNQNGNN